MGGINLIVFEPHGGVAIEPLRLAPAILSELEGNLMLFFTGSQRDARALLSHQVAATENDAAVVSRLQQMVDLAYEMRDLLLAGDLDAFGSALHRGWELKRGISAQISTSTIDDIYGRALAAGALGGKLAGAGGGGFLLLYCPRPAQARVRHVLSGQQSVEFRFDWGGARIAFAQ